MDKTEIQKLCTSSLIENLGIEFLEADPGQVRLQMPVDERTRQPFGFLHGGATISLAETAASFASYIEVGEGLACFGYHLDVSLLSAVPEGGFVYATVSLSHKGRSTHIWDVRVSDGEDVTVALVRVTVKILKKN